MPTLIRRLVIVILGLSTLGGGVVGARALLGGSPPPPPSPGARTAVSDPPAREPAAGTTVLDFSGPGALPSVDGTPLVLGVISGPTGIINDGDLTSALHEIGVATIRNNDYYDDRLDIEQILDCKGPTYPSWEGCDPEKESSYNWTASDALMATFKAGGFDPFLRLGGEWQNHSPKHDFKGPQNPRQEKNWIVAAQKVAARYRADYTWLDIWTEFPGPHFWDRSPDDFVRFWVDAYAAIKKSFPEKKVGGPGFAALVTVKVTEGQDSPAVALLKEMYRRKLAPDWLGWHSFQNDPLSFRQAGRAYRDLLDGKGQYARMPWAGTGFFASTVLVLDAFSTSKMDGNQAPLPPRVLEAIYAGGPGAALAAAMWIALEGTDTNRAYWYRASDIEGSPEGRGKAAHPKIPGGGTGLFRGDSQNTPKPTAWAFRLWHTLSRQHPVMVSTLDPDATGREGLWALLATNAEGGHALFVANAGRTPQTWDARLPGGRTLADYPKARVYTVDGTRDGGRAEALGGGPCAMAAGSVSLVVLD